MNSNPSGDTQSALTRAHDAISAGRMDEAAQLCRGVLDEDPDQPSALHLLGLVALVARRNDEALALIERAASLDGTDALLLMRLGVARALNDQHEGAVESFEKAAELAPDDYDIHLNLALALKELNRQAETEAALRRAIEIDPDNPQAWSELGVLLLTTGALDEALTTARRATSIAPHMALAHNNVGSIQLKLGDAASAVALFRRTIELAPRLADAHLNLGLALLVDRRAEEAIAAFREAIRLQPKNAVALAHLAHTYEILNRRAEARDAATRALKIDPGLDRAALALVHVDLREANRPLPDIKDSLEAIVGRAADDRNRITALNDLARVQDQLGDFDVAFRTFTDCQLLAARQPRAKRIDRTQFPVFLESNRWFLQQPIADWQFEIDDGLMSPVFLVGFPRSGATLLERVLGAHPSFVTSDQRPWLSSVTARIGSDYPQALASMNVDAISELRHHYVDNVRSSVGELEASQQIVDKDPLNFVRLGLVRRVFPAAKAIFVIRDPRDVVLSCFMQWFRPNDATVHFYELESTAQLYAAAMSFWRELKVVLGLDILEVRYEDIVKDLPTTSREILDFLGVAWDPAVLNFADTSEGAYVATPSRHDVAREVYADSVGRWRNYHEQMEPVLGILSPFVSALGYTDS